MIIWFLWWVGLWRKLSTKEFMLLNCGVGEDCSESLGLQGDQPWDFFGRNDAKAETPVLWPLMRRVDSLEKTLMQGEIGGRRRRGWQRMRWLDGITDSMDVESEWTPGIGDGQGGLACCDSWGRKELDTTEWLNWTDLYIKPAQVSFYPQRLFLVHFLNKLHIISFGEILPYLRLSYALSLFFLVIICPFLIFVFDIY